MSKDSEDKNQTIVYPNVTVILQNFYRQYVYAYRRQMNQPEFTYLVLQY